MLALQRQRLTSSGNTKAASTKGRFFLLAMLLLLLLHGCRQDPQRRYPVPCARTVGLMGLSNLPNPRTGCILFAARTQLHSCLWLIALSTATGSPGPVRLSMPRYTPTCRSLL